MKNSYKFVLLLLCVTSACQQINAVGRSIPLVVAGSTAFFHFLAESKDNSGYGAAIFGGLTTGFAAEAYAALRYSLEDVAGRGGHRSSNYVPRLGGSVGRVGAGVLVGLALRQVELKRRVTKEEEKSS